MGGLDDFKADLGGRAEHGGLGGVHLRGDADQVLDAGQGVLGEGVLEDDAGHPLADLPALDAGAEGVDETDGVATGAGGQLEAFTVVEVSGALLDPGEVDADDLGPDPCLAWARLGLGYLVDLQYLRRSVLVVADDAHGSLFL